MSTPIARLRWQVPFAAATVLLACQSGQERTVLTDEPEVELLHFGNGEEELVTLEECAPAAELTDALEVRWCRQVSPEPEDTGPDPFRCSFNNLLGSLSLEAADPSTLLLSYCDFDLDGGTRAATVGAETLEHAMLLTTECVGTPEQGGTVDQEVDRLALTLRETDDGRLPHLFRFDPDSGLLSEPERVAGFNPATRAALVDGLQPSLWALSADRILQHAYVHPDATVTTPQAVLEGVSMWAAAPRGDGTVVAACEVDGPLTVLHLDATGTPGPEVQLPDCGIDAWPTMAIMDDGRVLVAGNDSIRTTLTWLDPSLEVLGSTVLPPGSTQAYVVVLDDTFFTVDATGAVHRWTDVEVGDRLGQIPYLPLPEGTLVALRLVAIDDGLGFAIAKQISSSAGSHAFLTEYLDVGVVSLP